MRVEVGPGSEAEAADELAVGAGDEVRADEFADALRGLGAGLDGRLDAADVALDDDRDEAAADLDLPDEATLAAFTMASLASTLPT